MKPISNHATGSRSMFSRKTTWALTSLAALFLLSVLVQKTSFHPEQTASSPAILNVPAEPNTEIAGSPRNPAFPAVTFTSSGKETRGLSGEALSVKSSEESPLRRWLYGNHWGKESDPALAAFSGWAQRYLGADEKDRAGMVTEGVNLAELRRQAMLDLIAADPREALASSVPFSVRQQLPDAITAQLEQRVSGKGNLLVLASVAHESDRNGRPGILRHALIGEERFTAHVFGDRKDQRTTTDVSLHGVALDHQLALSDSPIRLLESGEQLNATAKPAEVICSVSGLTAGPTTGGAVLAASGDQTHWLCRGGHIEALEYNVRATEGGSSNGGVVAPSFSSTGARKILVIMVDFSDVLGGPVSRSTAQASINDVTAFIRSNAFNQINFTTKDVTPTLRMPRTAAYYVTTAADGAFELMADARSAATAAGYASSNYDFDVIAFANIGFPWGGLGYVGWKGSWVQGNFHRGVTAHELGHNFGNWHANSWVSSTIIGADGMHNEYGNPFDVLGNAGNYPRSHHSANFKFLNGWLPNANIYTITANGTYRIYAQDFGGNLDPARKYAIRVPVGISAGDETEDYWIDFRPGYGNTATANGAVLKWGNDFGTQSGSRLLDTQPGTLWDMEDAPLVVGSTFTDSARGLSITTLAKGGSGANSYLDIRINFYATPPVTLVEALDLTNATWTTGGNQPWTGQTPLTHDGTDAAASGTIMNNQQSYVETTMTGPGTLTYWWKVSSEANFDFLSLHLDGLVTDSISGEQGWQKRTNAVPAGSHTLRWRYSKDGSVVSGGDRGWLDEVTFTPTYEAPINDMFASRTTLTGMTGSAMGYNDAATKESGEPNHAYDTGGHSVWWSWTAPASGVFVMDTIGSSFDTLLAVYTGNYVAGLSPVASDDQGGPDNTSRLNFTAVAGTTYQIAVDGWQGDTGDILLNFRNVVPPSNDAFASRIPMTGTTVAMSGSNEGATAESGEPLHDGIPGGHSVWWSWTAPASGVIAMDTIGSSFDTLLAVYTGNSVAGLSPVASDDQGGPDNTSRLSFTAVVGTTYQIAVDGYYGVTGSIQINVRPAPSLVMLPPERLAGGTFRIRLGSADNTSVDPARIPSIAIYATTNLAQPLSAWTLLPGNITSSNGVTWIDDPEARNLPMRFYRAVERP